MKPSLNHPSRNDFSAHILLEIEQEERERQALCAHARRERQKQGEVSFIGIFKWTLIWCAMIGVGILIAHNIWPTVI